MIEVLSQFVVSALAIVVAGIFLVRSSERIGELTKIGSLFAGSLLLAGATSLPELLVDISAIRSGLPDLAVGDLMGSSLMNLLILAVADLSHRSSKKMFSRAGAQHALSATISINMTAIAAIAIFLSPHLARIGLGEIGLGPIAIGISYLLALRLLYFDRPKDPVRTSESAQAGRKELVRSISVYFASALAIFVAAPYLAEAAGKISELSGLGDTFVGTTLVAFCTSLPEIVSTVTAVRMGAFELAVGNIFGSNAFNMVLLIPLDYIHEGSLLGAVSRNHVLTALSVILASSVAVMGQLYQVERRRKLVEPDAFAVIGIVTGALLILYWLGVG